MPPYFCLNMELRESFYHISFDLPVYVMADQKLIRTIYSKHILVIVSAN